MATFLQRTCEGGESGGESQGSLEAWVSSHQFPHELYLKLQEQDIKDVDTLRFCDTNGLDNDILSAIPNNVMSLGKKADFKRAVQQLKHVETEKHSNTVLIEYEKLLLQQLRQQKQCYQRKLSQLPEHIAGCKQRQERLKQSIEEMFHLFAEKLKEKQDELESQTKVVYESAVKSVQQQKQLYQHKIDGIDSLEHRHKAKWTETKPSTLDTHSSKALQAVIDENKHDLKQQEEDDFGEFTKYEKIQQTLQRVFLRQMEEMLTLHDASAYLTLTSTASNSLRSLADSIVTPESESEFEEKYYELKKKYEALLRKYKVKATKYSALLRDYNEYIEQEQKEMEHTQQAINRIRSKFVDEKERDMQIRVNGKLSPKRSKKRKPKIKYRHSAKIQISPKIKIDLLDSPKDNDMLEIFGEDEEFPFMPQLERPRSATIHPRELRSTHIRASKSMDCFEFDEEFKDDSSAAESAKDDLNVNLKPRRRKYKPVKRSKSGMRLKEAKKKWLQEHPKKKNKAGD
eukprot:CAMPEP_0197021810 /NCGR_PEP_ID=MMETSP1384-20130603/2715_1 /TAXON_ID=29189 /ORGANISM="Ammonia sp." /LENGTH=513 /DNA_ID=CAMNT_0042449721 /DNA_START=50 /DNA_END=1591 /DNA_ORIENTATION=+